MAFTLADRQHSENDPRPISARKIILSLGAILSATIFRKKETHQKNRHHHMCHDQEADAEGRSPEGQRIAP